jgi:hypothetical protein
MTDQEIIDVVTAHRDGKTIQWSVSKKEWHDCDNPIWNFNCTNYRVKPVPQEIYVNKYFLDGHLGDMLYNNEEEARKMASSQNSKVVKFREVIE